MADGWLKTPFTARGRRIWIAGHKGMVGAALCRRLAAEGAEILTSDVDLRRQEHVERWIAANRPQAIVIAAARVGGILANRDYPVDFLYDNLMIAANIMHAAAQGPGVERLLFLGSSCIYPAGASQPIAETALLTGPLEPTNEAYAIAKIAGLKLCEAYRRQEGRDFISVMPCNLYGPGDRFDLARSHVIPALMMKAHAAKIAGDEVLSVWGSGRPLREFLYVDDLAEALAFALENYADARPLNIGSGEEVSIAALAGLIAQVAGFEGKIVFDAGKPDGPPRKVMDSMRIRGAGWHPRVSLKDGLAETYRHFLETRFEAGRIGKVA